MDTILRQTISDNQTALLLPVMGIERVRLGDIWLSVRETEPGQSVNEISFLGRHGIKPGEVIKLENDMGDRLSIETISLTYVETANLTSTQLAGLDAPTLEDYFSRLDREIPSKGWYIEFGRITAGEEYAPEGAEILAEIMTPQEIAQVYNLSESTVRVNIHRGKIKARKSGGTWLVRRADAEARWG